MSPIHTDTSNLFALVLAAVAVGLFMLYRRLLPKPNPGIPFNEAASRSILGDIPALQREGKDEPISWMISEAIRHPGPIFQLFLNPLDKPFVVLTDYREAQDILLRRKEWDRSSFSIDILSGQLPFNHINMKTGPVWKAHRRLLQDLMTPGFLHDIAAPNIYHSALALTNLWRVKAQKANGRAFDAEHDIYHAALDAVLDFGFGPSFPHRAVPQQLKSVESMVTGKDSQSESDIMKFPTAELDDTLEATLHVAEAIGDVSGAPFTKLAWWWKNRQPIEKKLADIRESFIREQVLMAKDKLESQDYDNNLRSAVDLMMHRERLFAQKDGREPVYWSGTIRDEILGFIIAGHDTTSTTLLWITKFLTSNPRVQAKLRDALQSTHTESFSEGRLPSHREITSSTCAYLEAVIEETLRLGTTIAFIDREATEDTTILGGFIPKGTTLIMPCRGPSISQQAVDIDEGKRTHTSKLAAQERGIREWSGSDEEIGSFYPERWLETSPDTGVSTFNATAGPILAFGLGTRGCFGRKLAYLELRLMATLLAWTFEFQEAPIQFAGLESRDGLTHKPKHNYIRLAINSN